MTKGLAERVHRGRRAIALARHRGLDTLAWERHLVLLLAKAGREPAKDEGREPWMLWEWRRQCIPEWRRILQESVDGGKGKREEYARWMLQDILLDPDYQDEAQE